jgi:hypothetical protein
VLVIQDLIARNWAVLTASTIALATLIVAAIRGQRFVSQGGLNGASMTMAVLAGAAILCYETALYLLPSPRQA